MVCANPGTVGVMAEGCRALSEFVNVFAGEHLWAELGPWGVRGNCSSLVCWNPRFALGLWERLQPQEWAALEAEAPRLYSLQRFLAGQFAARGFADTACDRIGARATGFLQTSLRNRGPYPSASLEDVEALRQWCRKHFPALLRL